MLSFLKCRYFNKISIKYQFYPKSTNIDAFELQICICHYSQIFIAWIISTVNNLRFNQIKNIIYYKNNKNYHYNNIIK